jgi:flagellum-specific ATP synthase
MAQVVDKPHLNAARALKEMAARHARVRDLIPLGAYVPGADPITDRAVELAPRMDAFLRQGTSEAAPMDTCVTHLEDLMA